MTVARFSPPPSSAQMGGLKKILRKAAPIVAGAAAVAAGQPQLAVAAASGAASATKKKKKGVVDMPAPPVQPVGFLDSLAPADRQVLLIGGAVVGTLLVSKLLIGRK